MDGGAGNHLVITTLTAAPPSRRDGSSPHPLVGVAGDAVEKVAAVPAAFSTTYSTGEHRSMSEDGHLDGRADGWCVDSYDVVVVGAGPAGLAAAAETARRGARTLVLDKAREIGSPVRTSGGAFIPLMRRLGIPDCLWHPISTIAFEGATRRVRYDYPEPFGCVLEVGALYRWLAGEAERAGAEVVTGMGVETPLLDGDRVIGVTTRTGRHIRARIVVDATGNWCKLGKALGLVPPARAASGLEVVVEIPARLRSTAAFTVDRPATYGWLFPERSGQARLGVGVIRPDSETSVLPELQHVADVLTQRYDLAPIDVRQRDLIQHAGVYPVRVPGSVPMVRPGLALVGDAAGVGSNLLGEGIRYAIESGRLAGAVIAEAGQGNLPDSHLQRYARRWKRRYGRRLRWAHSLNVKISGFTPAQWDAALLLAASWSPATMGLALSTQLGHRLAARLVRETSPGQAYRLVRAAVAQRTDR
jgi:digeranylgeranylglycerophospholipid reductase